ncbi:MAG: hypothetical protein ABR578_11510 [Chromatocurvus sp.]
MSSGGKDPWRRAWFGMGLWRWLCLALIAVWIATFVVRYGL